MSSPRAPRSRPSAKPPSGGADRARRRWLAATLAAAAAPLAACGGSGGTPAPSPSPSPAATRSWRMGFSPNPPRPTVDAMLKDVDTFSSRSELCIIHEEPPWTELLAGATPDAYLDAERVALVDYMRGKGLRFMFMGDLNDGLDRSKDSPKLVAAGRSITEPAIQALYRDYMLAVDRKLKPDVMGLVAESNLIRVAAPALYPAIRKTANDTAAALRAAGSSVQLMASVQVEVAWGHITGVPAGYVGVETDFADFPFVQVLGLSSYPYFGWNEPEDLPLDYYTRPLAGRTLPVMVVEGGWASAAAGSVTSTPEKQARFFARQAQLLDAAGAKAWLQLVFADIDISSVPPPVPANLPLFVSIGLTDSDFNPKPALAAWDTLFARHWTG